MNNLKNYLFTSESVSEGHPDKVCDRISDMVVDSYLSIDPFARVACETLTTTNKVVLAGEVRGPDIKSDDIISNVRNCIKDIGYDQDGFHYNKLQFFNFLDLAIFFPIKIRCPSKSLSSSKHSHKLLIGFLGTTKK